MGTVAVVTREGGNAMLFVLIETFTAGLALDTGWPGRSGLWVVATAPWLSGCLSMVVMLLGWWGRGGGFDAFAHISVWAQLHLLLPALAHGLCCVTLGSCMSMIFLFVKCS